MIVELDETNFEKEAMHGLKLIEFYATWCTYCMKQRIEFENFENSGIWIGIVDGDESPNLAAKYSIQAYPTFIVLKDGEKIAQFSGFHTKPELLSKLTPLI